MVNRTNALSTKRLFSASVNSPNASWRTRALLHQAETELAAGSGELELAFERLASSVDAGLIDLLWIDRCPLLGPLRNDARFAPLRARVATRCEEVGRALVDARSGRT